LISKGLVLLGKVSAPRVSWVYKKGIMFLIWLQFSISAIIILIAGTKLSLYADVVSEKTGLGKGWTVMSKCWI